MKNATMKAGLACILAAVALAACDQDSRPEQPSPGMPPKPTVDAFTPRQIADTSGPAQETPLQASGSAVATTLFATPGALPAAERHFELFQQMQGDRTSLVEARFSLDVPSGLATARN